MNKNKCPQRKAAVDDKGVAISHTGLNSLSDGRVTEPAGALGVSTSFSVEFQLAKSRRAPSTALTLRTGRCLIWIAEGAGRAIMSARFIRQFVPGFCPVFVNLLASLEAAYEVYR